VTVLSKMIIWDFDETLAYRDGKWSGALLEAILEHSPDATVSIEDLRRHLKVGFPWHNPETTHAHGSPESWWETMIPIFHGACRGSGVGEEDSRIIAANVRKHYVDISTWRVYEDTFRILDYLKEKGWRQLILSNHVPELEGIVDGLGMQPYFEAIYSSANTGFEKPNRLAYEHALEKAGKAGKAGKADRIWMVGDSFACDYLAPEKLGIPSILFRNSHREAKRACTDSKNLLEILESPN
jgi:HAD superfamily hydrolase (TIGR01549 family)